jgi:hypothetical protein
MSSPSSVFPLVALSERLWTKPASVSFLELRDAPYSELSGIVENKFMWIKQEVVKAEDASIDREAYERFKQSINEIVNVTFLKAWPRVDKERRRHTASQISFIAAYLNWFAPSSFQGASSVPSVLP